MLLHTKDQGRVLQQSEADLNNLMRRKELNWLSIAKEISATSGRRWLFQPKRNH